MLHQNIDYLNLVKKSWRNLKIVPSDKQTEPVCLAAIKQDGKALKYVSPDNQTETVCLAAVQDCGDYLKYVTRDKRTEVVCLAAVKKYGDALRYVARDMLTQAICLAAVQRDGETLRYLYLVPDKQTEAVCIAGVKQDGKFLEYVAPNKRTEAVCFAAVLQNSNAIQFVPPDKQTEGLYFAMVQQNGTALAYVAPDKQTEALCLTAVKQDGRALQYVAPDKQTEALCLIAVSENGHGLQGLKPEKQTEAICFAAVQQNAYALAHVALDKQTEALCLAAVQQNPDVLSLVCDQLKEKIINQLGVDYFTTSYETIKSIPINFKQEVDVLLSKKVYIVITKKQYDVEVADTQKVYLAQKKNAISAHPKQIDQLLNDLKSANNIQDLHLVLIDHSGPSVVDLAGLSTDQIRNVCEKYPNIKHIHLLGCQAAQANTLATEKTMMDAYSRAIQSRGNLKYGLQTTTNATHNDADFQKKCLSFCKKNKLNGLYILSKDDDSHYRLMVMKLNANDHLVEKVTLIPAVNIAAIDKIINKKLVFPKKKATVNTICGPQNILTDHQLAVVRALTSDKERFYPDHPKYKADKTRYPFLTTLEANSNELTESLLKRLANAFQKNPVTQDVNIKGASNLVSVDGYKKCLFVSEKALYKNSYKTTFYNTNTSNIKYDELAKERRKLIDAIRKGFTPMNNTMAKNIRVVLPGKKVI